MGSKLKWRHPDRPLHIFSLKMVKEGKWMSQPKYDGHFAVIEIEDAPKIMSRHNKPLPVSQNLVDVFKSIPKGVVLWGEWTGRRQANKEEAIYLFSIVYNDFKWLGRLTEEERYEQLTQIQLPDTPNISVVENRFDNHAQHYKETINNWKLEGIVLKRKDMKLIGDLSKPKDNPAFLKLKWREGADGMSINIIPDEDLVCTGAF